MERKFGFGTAPEITRKLARYEENNQLHAPAIAMITHATHLLLISKKNTTIP